jgi:L-fuconolactonase
MKPEDLFICDAMVHGPDPAVRPVSTVGGMAPDDLERMMTGAGVDCAIVVPLVPSDTERTIAMFATARPDRFAAVALLPLANLPGVIQTTEQLRTWRATPGVVAIRAGFLFEDVRPLLVEERLEWLWEAASEAGLPVMIHAPDNVPKVGGIAQRHPGLKIVLDHMGLAPFRVYDDPLTAIAPVLDLARYPNVAVKATGLPSSSSDGYPFESLHRPVREVVRAFGAQRVFWGTDWTRLHCDYSDVVRLFTDALAFLTQDELELIMGRAICSWLGWQPEQSHLEDDA